MQRVIVIGGGLAGLASAAALGRYGLAVELFEARPRLGGRASSFRDAASGEVVDTCQHVAMGCCTNFIDFCRRTDIDHLFRRERTLYFIDPEGRLSQMGASALPAPLHLLPAFARSRLLCTEDKWHVARGLMQLCFRHLGGAEERTGGGVDSATSAQEAGTLSGRDISFAEWLSRSGQTRSAIDRFWSVILTSALSEELDRIDVDHARKVFRDAFLAHPGAWEMLVPRVPLGELYGRRLSEALARSGVRVRLNCAVRRICMKGTRADAVELRDGSRIGADAIVFAGTPDRLLGALPENLIERHAYFQRLGCLESAPITSVHLWFDRPITALPHAVVVGRTTQWVFNRTALHANLNGQTAQRPQAEPSGAVRTAHYYQVVISASRHLRGVGSAKTLETVQSELAELFPAARKAVAQHTRVVTERSAVFSVRPGIERLRPPQQSPVDNLFLAGDWTRTGWPATMEGAVRSGYLAAEAVLARVGRSASIVRPDLSPGLLSRLALAPRQSLTDY